MSNDELGSNLDVETVVDKPAPKLKAAKEVKPDRIRIILEENDAISGHGQFFGHNGTGYFIRPGVEVDIPLKLKELLDNAVISTPVIDPATKQVIGYRDRLRFPYRVVSR